jgi:hypothetical protein
MPYAERTRVPVAQSRTELERVLQRYGATAFGYGWEDGNAVVQFRVAERYVRISVGIPDDAQQERQRWRALVLVVKAKLEGVEAGIETLEEAFMAHVVLPDNTTVGAFMLPQIEQAYTSGGMPKLLPGG